MEAWTLAAGATVLVLLALALRLRGPGGGSDLTGPPRRRGRAFSAEEAERIGGLVARGERDEALRLIRAGGHDDEAARKLVELIERLQPAADGEPDSRDG